MMTPTTLNSKTVKPTTSSPKTPNLPSHQTAPTIEVKALGLDQSRLASLIFLLTDLSADESATAARVALYKRKMAVANESSDLASQAPTARHQPAQIDERLPRLVELLTDAISADCEAKQ